LRRRGVRCRRGRRKVDFEEIPQVRKGNTPFRLSLSLSLSFSLSLSLFLSLSFASVRRREGEKSRRSGRRCAFARRPAVKRDASHERRYRVRRSRREGWGWAVASLASRMNSAPGKPAFLPDSARPRRSAFTLARERENGPKADTIHAATTNGSAIVGSAVN